jgi:hypothetical protein
MGSTKRLMQSFECRLQCFEAGAPSTALRAVPLPRFAGEDKKGALRAVPLPRFDPRFAGEDKKDELRAVPYPLRCAPRGRMKSVPGSEP